jgi:hypothetical protein
MRTFVVSIVTGVAVGLLAAPARADDRWDVQGTADDSSATENQLVHGMLQVAHDLAGPSGVVPTDQDWFLIAAQARHSYEGRVHGSNILWDAGACPDCPRFDRVDAGGAILTAGTVPPTDSSLYFPIYATTLSVRWISNVDETTYLRAQGAVNNSESATDLYDVDFLDTTYFVPRWNNSGGQVTVFLIQNDTAATVGGSAYFYNGAGTLLSTQPVSVAPFALQVINTSSIGALAGQSGSAAIAHTGGWGALSGKAVALEPSTGFSFDTPFASLPR